MSTNYYAAKLPTEQEIKRTQELLKASVLHPLDVSLRETFDETIKEMQSSRAIHLGKRSAGWQFCWEYHDGKYYQDNLGSIMEFLSQPGITIFNEYGVTFTMKEFLYDEICDVLNNCGFTPLQTMTEWETNHPECHSSERTWISEDGLEFTTAQFS